jgi:hypothetical protein
MAAPEATGAALLASWGTSPPSAAAAAALLPVLEAQLQARRR